MDAGAEFDDMIREPDWWWHEGHGLHDSGHHQAHDPRNLCVPLFTWPPENKEAEEAAREVVEAADLAQKRGQSITPTRVRLSIVLLRQTLAQTAKRGPAS